MGRMQGEGGSMSIITEAKEVDGLLMHRCSYCNAEIEAIKEEDLIERVQFHYKFVKCIEGY